MSVLCLDLLKDLTFFDLVEQLGLLAEQCAEGKKRCDDFVKRDVVGIISHLLKIRDEPEMQRKCLQCLVELTRHSASAVEKVMSGRCVIQLFDSLEKWQERSELVHAGAGVIGNLWATRQNDEIHNPKAHRAADILVGGLKRYHSVAKIQHTITDAMISILHHSNCGFDIREKMAKNKVVLIILDNLREHQKIPAVVSNMFLLIAHLADGSPLVQRQVQFTTPQTVCLLVDIVYVLVPNKTRIFCRSQVYDGSFKLRKKGCDVQVQMIVS